MAYTVMAYIDIAYIVMAYVGMVCAGFALQSARADMRADVRVGHPPRHALESSRPRPF